VEAGRSESDVAAKTVWELESAEKLAAFAPLLVSTVASNPLGSKFLRCWSNWCSIKQLFSFLDMNSRLDLGCAAEVSIMDCRLRY
jgi:hypothetical protein